VRGGQTILAAARSELPLQVQCPIYRPAGRAVVTLLTPAGALLAGDEIALDVDCAPGARLDLVQPAATKLHRCPEGSIRCSLHARVAAGAMLRYLPRELIPHADSEYHQHVHLDLESGAEAVLCEIVTPGRLFERFQYRRLVLRLEACVDGELVVVDAMRLERGGEAALMGYTHFASLFYLSPRVTQADADDLHARIRAAGVVGSASLLPAYGLSARLLGTSADELRAALEPLPAPGG
jgi:urease accessory protein